MAYSHYRTSSELSEVCSLAATLHERSGERRGYFELEDLEESAQLALDWKSLSQKVARHERLMSEDSREGREYRWRFRVFRELEKKCRLDFPFTGEKE